MKRKKSGLLNVINNKKLVERAFLLMLSDICAVLFATVGALWIRYDFSFLDIAEYFWNDAIKMLPYNLVSTLIIFGCFKLYVSLWRYAGTGEMVKIAIAVVIDMLLRLIVFRVFAIRVPRSYYLFYAAILGAGTIASRFSYRFLRSLKRKHFDGKSATASKVIIVGAGTAGNTILKEIDESALPIKVVCLIDDNASLRGTQMRGKLVFGNRDSIPEAVNYYDADEIIIAIPSAPKSEISKIVDICKDTGCELKIVPSLYQLINNDVIISQIRNVEIDDLLGRDPVKIADSEVSDYLKGKCVMITGGGGSIGSELARQVAAHNPSKLIIFDIYENNAYYIQQELIAKYPELELLVLIGSVRDEVHVNSIFEKYRPGIVFHAAAHKHVPLMEDSPGEAIKNNVIGTYNTAKAADKYGVRKFVLVSTDKAVNPTNVMGATKRICEMIIRMMSEKSKTEFAAVRFGNVLGSNGSVIPLFKKQIAAGGPVTVTDPEVIRYFMTINEAVALILQAGAYATGGEIFVLDMGQPVKILDLARNLISLSGLKEGEDIDIVYTGLRPGEKMYEELLMSEEGLKKTANELIFVGNPIEFDTDVFQTRLKKLMQVSEMDSDFIRKSISEIVPTYHCEG